MNPPPHPQAHPQAAHRQVPSDSDFDAPLPAEPKRSSWGSLAAGAVLGSIVTAALFGIVVRQMVRHETSSTAVGWRVDKDTVRVEASAVPLRFDTAPAEMGSPLPPNPVTARVATFESRTAPSFAPLDGRVTNVAVHIGDHVKEGDKLVLVRSGDLASMQRELRAAQLAIRTKQALADRLQLLVDSRAASQNDLMVAQSELNEATLTAAAAGAKLRSLSVRQEGDTGYWVLATRSGIVVQLDATPGKQVGPDKDHPIATVADLDEVLVVGDLPQKEARSLSPGTEVVVREPGTAQEPSKGVVEVVSDVLDPERQTVPIRIKVANPEHQLRPGEFVEISFTAKPGDQVLLVPTDAVVSDGANSVVFVETSPGVLKRRPVRLGRQATEKTEITSGLAPGEHVVVRGALLLLNAIDVKG